MEIDVDSMTGVIRLPKMKTLPFTQCSCQRKLCQSPAVFALPVKMSRCRQRTVIGQFKDCADNSSPVLVV